MDGDGIPLAFDMYEGNKNEQTTLKPLEKRIIRDFQLSKFIYYSDAGLSSKKNKEFNSIQNRTYIIYRLLADKLENKYTVNELLKTLREMEVVDTQYNGYIPAYKRTEITDELHQIFGFRTDYEIIGKKKMRNIIKNTKNV